MIKRIILSLISIFAFVLFSCNGILNDVEEEQSSSNKAYVRIGDASSRTVLPANLTATDMTDIKLVGEKDGESKELLSAATYSKLSGQSAEIEAGTWSFTLSATINGATFSDSTSCKNVEVSAGQTLSLTFSAMETSATTGGFTVTVNFEGNAKAVAVLFGGEELSGNEVVLTNNTVTVSKDGIAPDDYPIQIKFYADEAKKLCLNTFSELVRIEAGHKSEATYNISLNDEVRYLVMFKSNGGTEVASQKIESGKTATEPTAPTKDGYAFAGWFTDSGLTAAFTFNTAITADITLYAKWIEAAKTTFTVTFSVDGAETKQTVAEGEKAVKPADPTKTGYTFDGWYKDDTKFDFETTVTVNLTLTAKWTLITYTITYEGLNGVENPNTITSYTVESETITLQNPTRTGYTFVWMNGSDEVTQITKGSTGNITLTGKWTAISYEITYVLPNGVTNPNVTSYTIETDTITLQSPARTGYTFNGWYDAETGGNKIEIIAQGSTGAKTFYAKWILGEKEKPSAVGDIVFSDGSATAYTSELTLTDEQKSKAVAVIFYVGSASDTLGAKTLGVGLKNTGTGSTPQWARYTSDTDKAEGFSTNITAIQCTPSEEGSGVAATATFTGDLDGSDNWQALCDTVSDEGTSGNYPAWEWVNAYATTASLTGDYTSGWYLPTVAELSMLYRVKDIVNSALEKAGGTKIADASNSGYWSSSQSASKDNYAWFVSFGAGYLDGLSKMYKVISVCTVRAF